MKKFILTSLFAAGFSLNATAQNNDAIINLDSNDRIDFNNNTMGIESIIEKNLPFTLAGHSSHRSHGSHGSHGSHRSSSHSSHSSSSHSSHFWFRTGLCQTLFYGPNIFTQSATNVGITLNHRFLVFF